MGMLAMVVDTHVSTRDCREWLMELVERTLRVIDLPEDELVGMVYRIETLPGWEIDALFDKAMADLGVET